MNKVYIETNGCAVLRHETYKIAKYIELNGFEEVSVPKKANYIIMTGCAVIDVNEKFGLEAIKRLYTENKDHATIIVAGCIPTISKKKIEEISKDIIQITNHNMEKFDELFYKTTKIDDVTFNINPKRHHSFGDPQIIVSEAEAKDYKFAQKIDKNVGNNLATMQFNYSTRGRHLWREEDLFEIRVSYGCSSNCSYCATKLAIGNFRGVAEDKILEQAELANSLGFNRIMLMGDEIGFWRWNHKNIVDLINDILKINSNFKIGIRYIHPDIITRYYKEFKPLFEKGSIFYFCSAFQSGSSRILKLMNRNPDVEKFIECMEDMVKNNFPVLRHTQIIIGFPTETDTDVLETIAALQRASFDHVTISSYSPREGTKAFDFEQVSSDVILKRMNLINNWLELNRNNKL